MQEVIIQEFYKHDCFQVLEHFHDIYSTHFTHDINNFKKF